MSRGRILTYIRFDHFLAKRRPEGLQKVGRDVREEDLIRSYEPIRSFT
jgi:hypothetical protein